MEEVFLCTLGIVAKPVAPFLWLVVPAISRAEAAYQYAPELEKSTKPLAPYCLGLPPPKPPTHSSPLETCLCTVALHSQDHLAAFH
jgi:hypothetical protein